jgi:hypothetical protein
VFVREIAPDNFEVVEGDIQAGDVNIPFGNLRLWSDAELARFAVYNVDPPAIPEGKIVTGRRIERVNGVVTVVYDLADPTPPTPEELTAMRETQVDAIGVALRALFNHENRIRALARGMRAISSQARTAADAQGVEPARADLTLLEFRALIRAMLD